MLRFERKRIFLGTAIALLAMCLAGCAGHRPEPGTVFPCAADHQIEKNIAAEAELVEFSCILKSWEGSDTLHFNVGLKNVSDQPQRYKVNIFLDNGKAVGGLIPRKTNKGLVEPGKTASFTYPVGGMNCMPGPIVLIVKTIAQ